MIIIIIIIIIIIYILIILINNCQIIFLFFQIVKNTYHSSKMILLYYSSFSKLFLNLSNEPKILLEHKMHGSKTLWAFIIQPSETNNSGPKEKPMFEIFLSDADLNDTSDTGSARPYQ
jgi:hypothetical protein